MRHYHLAPKEVLSLARDTIDFLIAGLIWTGDIKEKTPEEDVEEQRRQSWKALTGKVNGSRIQESG